MLTNSAKILFTSTLVVFLFACSNVKSVYDYDSNVDFTVIKTYQWDTQPSASFTAASPLVAKRVLKAIDDNLKRKGLVEGEDADIKISYRVQYEKKLSSSNVTGSIGMSMGGHSSIGLSRGNSIREITEGTLTIDMTSTRSNSLIWRSTTTKPISGRDATPQESEKRIGQLIYAVFDNFPPKQQ